MKTILKFIICLLIVNAFMCYIYAEDDEYDNLSIKSQEQIDTARNATEKYCSESAKSSGCIFDANNTLYTQSQKHVAVGKYVVPYANIVSQLVFPEGVELTKGYQGFNGKGNGVFAGCYKTYITQEYLNQFSLGGKNYQYNARNFTGPGTYFLFQIVELRGNSCAKRVSFVIPAQGVINYGPQLVNSKKEPTKFDGQTDVTGYESPATINGWVAKENGGCPGVFGMTSNQKWYTALKNVYAFSENQNDFNISTYSFFGNEKYKSRPGCTVSDKQGEEKNEELLNEVLKEINNTQCPAKIEDMKAFNEKFETWYQGIRNNNDYRLLWSKELSDSVTIDNNHKKITAAIQSKMTNCQYKICGLTDSEISTVNSKKGSTCKNGCTIHRVEKQSDEVGAKCYACDLGIDNDKVLKWIKDPNNNSCERQSKMVKDQCIGTLNDYACRSCLLDAFKNSGLSEEKRKCLVTNEITMELTLANIDLESRKAAEEDVDKEIDENTELRDKMFAGDIDPVELYIYEEPMTCEEILGPVLTKIVKAGITIMQIAAAIIAIVKGMLILVPAVVAKDADALKKAGKTLVILGIILAIVIVFRPVIRLIGTVLEYDVSCIV